MLFGRLSPESRTWPVLAAGLVIAALLSIVFYSYTLEDAKITFRYALRLAEGFEYGMWNRVGEPVEGFTTTLWMLYISLAGPSVSAITHLAKFTGIASFLGIVVLLFAAHRKLIQLESPVQTVFAGQEETASWAFLASSLVAALCMPLAWYAASGMETITYAFLIVAMVFAPVLTMSVYVFSIIAAALVLIRPEGILVASATSLFWFAFTRMRLFLIALGVAFLTFAALTVFRLYYFGLPLPNTYYAKSGDQEGNRHLVFGIKYFLGALRYYGVVLFLIPILLVVSFVRKVSVTWLVPFLIAASLAYAAILARSGADNHSAFPHFRHALVLFPLALVVLFILVGQLPVLARNLLFLCVAIGVATIPLYQEYRHDRIMSDIRKLPDNLSAGKIFDHGFGNNKAIRWLQSISSEDTVIASALAGAIPLHVDAVHIDVLGLNDQEIATHGRFDPYGPVDSKSAMSLVLDRRPDIIEGYLSATVFLGDKPEDTILGHRSKMNLELFTDPRFRSDYLVVTNAQYVARDRVIFVHRDWQSAKGISAGVEVTSLEPMILAFDNLNGKKKDHLMRLIAEQQSSFHDQDQ